MGGKIKCLSKIGKGTTFHVTLKLKIDKSEPVPKIEKEPFDGLDGARILVAEDNDLNAEIAKFFIEQNGGKVIEAKNGFEAVKEFENSEVGGIDVILMDIMMPVMNGYEATKCIRLSNRPDGKTVPIIAMSANAFSDDIVQSKNSGNERPCGKAPFHRKVDFHNTHLFGKRDKKRQLKPPNFSPRKGLTI